MKSKIFKIILLVAIVACFVGFAWSVFKAMFNAYDSTDWEAKYIENAKDVIAPIKEKYEFAQAFYQKSKENNDSCIVVNKVEDLSYGQKAILKKHIEEEDSIVGYHSDECILIHNCPSGGKGFSSHEYFGLEKLELYEAFSGQKIDVNEFNFNVLISKLKQEVATFEKAKYLVVVTDKILVMPGRVTNFFYTGYVLSNVKIYNLKTRELIETIDVLSTNGEKVEVKEIEGMTKFEEYGLVDDLYIHHKYNIINKVLNIVSK